MAALLHTTGDIKALVAKAERLAQWQKRYADLAPPALARASRVTGLRSGTLLLRADNAAVAAKLKQQAPRLVKALNQLAGEVTSIRVQVQPQQALRPHGASAVKQGLPPAAVAQFEALSAAIPDPRLKSALGNLVARHRSRRMPVK